MFVVQVAQHGGVRGHRPQQRPELAQRMGPDRAVFIVAHHGAQVAFALVHAEVVEPEPAHLRLHLVGRVQRAQQVPGGGLARQAVHLLLVGLLGGFFGLVVAQGVGTFAALLQVLDQGQQRLLHDGHGVDLRLHCGGQALCAGVQLGVDISGQAHGLQLRHRTGRRPPGQLVRLLVGTGGRSTRVGPGRRATRQNAQADGHAGDQQTGARDKHGGTGSQRKRRTQRLHARRLCQPRAKKRLQNRRKAPIQER